MSARMSRLRIRVDLDLCQGHSVCIGEAPDMLRKEAALMRQPLQLSYKQR